MVELTKEEVMNLSEGTIYYVFNPLTGEFSKETANDKDIVHNKHMYEKLEFYLKEKKDGE